VTDALRRNYQWYLLAAVVLVLIWSGIAPRDRFTWVLEVSWVLAGIPLVVLTRHRFPLTHLLATLLALHALLLIVGGHYTYERVPLGEWWKEWFGWKRNHYDRLGHLVQGIVPAILAREILLRRSPLRPGKWLFFLVLCVCLAFSAFFELIEWWSALAAGKKADAFLGTQGDPWDAQQDMLCALVGSILSQIVFARWHSAQLRRFHLESSQ
jgi:putative membrane protein